MWDEKLAWGEWLPLAHALAGDGGCDSLLCVVDDVPAVNGRTVPEPTFDKIAGFLQRISKCKKFGS